MKLFFGKIIKSKKNSYSGQHKFFEEENFERDKKQVSIKSIFGLWPIFQAHPQAHTIFNPDQVQSDLTTFLKRQNYPFLENLFLNICRKIRACNLMLCLLYKWSGKIFRKNLSIPQISLKVFDLKISNFRNFPENRHSSKEKKEIFCQKIFG